MSGYRLDAPAGLAIDRQRRLNFRFLFAAAFPASEFLSQPDDARNKMLGMFRTRLMHNLIGGALRRDGLENLLQASLGIGSGILEVEIFKMLP